MPLDRGTPSDALARAQWPFAVNEIEAGPQLELNGPLSRWEKVIVPLAARALVKVPLTFADQFYVLRQNIIFVRQRLR